MFNCQTHGWIHIEKPCPLCTSVQTHTSSGANAIIGVDKFVCDLLTKQLSEAKAEVERLTKRQEHTEQFYAVRIQRLTDLLKATPHWNDVACILANGTSSPDEPPSYSVQINLLKSQLANSVPREAAMKLVEAVQAYIDNGDIGVITLEKALAEFRSGGER